MNVAFIIPPPPKYKALLEISLVKRKGCSYSQTNQPGHTLRPHEWNSCCVLKASFCHGTFPVNWTSGT